MELHHLRYVVKLAKCLHFSKAAAELSITQPSLSQQILLIERELGVRLFERKTRSVELTGAGEEFVAYADRVLVEWERLQEAMRKQSATKKGTLRVGTLLNMARLDINKQVLAFQKEHPHIQITIGEMVGSYELIKQLEADTFDVVFCIPSLEMRLNERIEIISILAGRVVAVVSKERPLAGNTVLALKDLAEESLLFPAKVHSLYGLVLSACRNSGFEPKIVGHSSQVETAVEMAAKGLGIALVSSQFAAASKCAGVAVLPIEPIIPRNIALAFSSNTANLSAVKVFRDFILRSTVGEHFSNS
jgi:LysR family transcriptional regulator, transcription activator of glutamate synthase operon